MSLVRQGQLDFLRGIAATYVVINHARGAFYIGGEKLLADSPTLLNYLTVGLLQLTSFGPEMVMLFFVLSGFAMAHSISHSPSVRRFYLKRIIRIWPPYIAACLLAFVVAEIAGVRIGPEILVYFNASGPVTPQFWSLPYEVVFYALCPFVLMRRRWFFWAAVLATIATLFLRGPLLNPWRSFSLDFVGNEMILFAIGALAYRNYHRIPEVSGRALLSLVAASVPVVWTFRYLAGGTNLVGDMIVAILTVLTIKNLPPMPKWANLGSFSYSIYIFHYALIFLAAWALGQYGIDPKAIRNPLLWAVFVPTTLGLCYLLYLVTERPCNRIVASLRVAQAQPSADADVRARASRSRLRA